MVVYTGGYERSHPKNFPLITKAEILAKCSWSVKALFRGFLHKHWPWQKARA